MMDIRWIAIAAALPLVACAAVDAPVDGAPDIDRTCKADAGQSFIGQIANSATGAALLRATGARTIRWVAPGMAVTMDYRPDRLTVSYDSAYKIERVSCG